MGGLKPGAATALAKWMPGMAGGVVDGCATANDGTLTASTLEWQNWQLLQTLLAGAPASSAASPAASAAGAPWQGVCAAFSEENPAVALVEWT